VYDFEFTQTAGTHKFRWPDKLLSVSVKSLHEHKTGQVSGEITVTTDAPGYKPLLHRANLNLSSTTARNTLSKTLSQRYNGANWDTILEQVCNTAIDAFREGEPIVEVFSCDEVKPPGYLLYPFLQLHKPTVIFGEGGDGKSLVGMLMAIAVILPWKDNRLGFSINRDGPTNVLWLDYETDRDTVTWNLSRFRNGLELPEVSLHYRRCSFPLTADVERIRNIIAEKNIGLLVIDSLGMACAGDLNSAETSIQFWGAQRQLNVTTLIIAHPSKDPLAKRRTIHGSGFFMREARSIWELKQVQEPGEEEKIVGLTHTKVNDGKLHRARGFRFLFSPNSIRVEKQDLDEVEEFRQQMSTGQQILTLLKDGDASVADIKEQTGLTENNIRVTLYRLQKRGKARKVGDNWGLAYQE